MCFFLKLLTLHFFVFGLIRMPLGKHFGVKSNFQNGHVDGLLVCFKLLLGLHKESPSMELCSSFYAKTFIFPQICITLSLNKDKLYNRSVFTYINVKPKSIMQFKSSRKNELTTL